MSEWGCILERQAEQMSDFQSVRRRKQLKALVTLHSKDEGFGGRLTSDEIQIITGAGCDTG